VAYFYRNIYSIVPEHFLFPFGCLIIGFLFYLFRIMGPGDSKYLFSLFLLINKDLQLIFFLSLVYTTVMVGSILLLLHAIMNFDKIKKAILLMDFGQLKGVFGTKFTFAPIIFLSWVGFGWKINIISI
jgi:prepilin peptidase CpaA